MILFVEYKDVCVISNHVGGYKATTQAEHAFAGLCQFCETDSCHVGKGIDIDPLGDLPRTVRLEPKQWPSAYVSGVLIYDNSTLVNGFVINAARNASNKPSVLLVSYEPEAVYADYNYFI